MLGLDLAKRFPLTLGAPRHPTPAGRRRTSTSGPAPQKWGRAVTRLPWGYAQDWSREMQSDPTPAIWIEEMSFLAFQIDKL